MEPIFAVTGATGNTGSVVARQLLAAGKKVRVIGRSLARLEPLTIDGADPVACDLMDAEALTRALSGTRAVYAMIPPDMAVADYRAYQDHVTDSLVSAVKKAKIRHVVTLSSVGAAQPAGTGPIAGFYYMEQQFNQVAGLHVLHLRAGYFMENLLAQVGIIKATGYAAGTLRPDLPLPMIATRDIGCAAADAMVRLAFRGHPTRELLGPRDVTMAEAARTIGTEIGKPDLQYAQSTGAQARDALIAMGLSPNVADLILEMSAALNTRLMAADEARTAANTTPTSLESFVHERFIPAYRGMATAG